MKTWSTGACLECKQYPQMSDATICLSCHRKRTHRPPPLPKKSKPSQNCDRQICRRCGVVGGHSELCREPIINKATAKHRLRFEPAQPPIPEVHSLAETKQSPEPDFKIDGMDRPEIQRYRILANKSWGFQSLLASFERIATTRRIIVFTAIVTCLYLTSAVAFAYTENRSLGVCIELGSKK